MKKEEIDLNKLLLVLLALMFLFSGCNEPQRQETLDCCNDKNSLIKENQNLIQVNATLEDTKNLYKSKYEEARQVQENDLKAMSKGLDGFASCHIAVTCSTDIDYEYEFFSCRELSAADLKLYVNSCVYSSAYNDFFGYVEQRGGLE